MRVKWEHPSLSSDICSTRDVTCWPPGTIRRIWETTDRAGERGRPSPESSKDGPGYRPESQAGQNRETGAKSVSTHIRRGTDKETQRTTESGKSLLTRKGWKLEDRIQGSERSLESDPREQAVTPPGPQLLAQWLPPTHSPAGAYLTWLLETCSLLSIAGRSFPQS